jgi:propanediol dehydratase large subunit
MSANRWRRFADWDERPLRLDKFARENPEAGFCAHGSPLRPEALCHDRRMAASPSIDGVRAEDFDMIDIFIAALPPRPFGAGRSDGDGFA